MEDTSLLRPLCGDDTVVYKLYLIGCKDGTDWMKKAMAWLRTVFPFLGGYIWQWDAFQLQLEGELGGNPVLRGETRFGDNVMDEWFIVFLLAELSRAFKDCVVQVNDNDGEFLLIEGAPDLPSWADPEICENRVYLMGGQLHLIPHGAPTTSMTVTNALELIRSVPEETIASAQLRGRIAKRLSGFPQDALTHNYHHCNLLVPEPLALALRNTPQLVAPAVRSFYFRDQSDLKHLRVMKRFDPRHHKAVMCRVRFTRCLFAQLLHQQFSPPTKGFVIPVPGDVHCKAATLGMKLCCGFEIWCANLEGAWSEMEEAIGRGGGINGGTETLPDDPEDWMLISPKEVDDLLAEKEQDAQAQLSETVDLMQEFLGHEATLDGAEVPLRNDAQEQEADDLFNVSKFLSALQQGLDLEDVGDLTAAVQEEMDRDLEGRAGLQGDFDHEDVDVNFVSNLVKGLEAANGEPGPLSNLMRHLQELK